MPKSIIPYPGGKQKMRKLYLKLISPHDLWCEVFCGAAHVTLAKDPAMSKLEIINDRYSWLVNFWRVIKHCPEKFLEQADMEIRSRAVFDAYKAWHNADEIIMREPDPEAAWAFWYLIRSSFTGSMSYPRWKYTKMGGPVSRNVHLAEVLERYDDIMAVYDRLQSVDIECLDFRDCIDRYDSPMAFFWCDPPYWTPKSGPQDYVYAFTPQDHLDLAAILKNISGKFLLTYEDSREVANAYNWAQIRPVSFNYSVPHAGSAGDSKVGRELIITNYNPNVAAMGPLFADLQTVDISL